MKKYAKWIGVGLGWIVGGPIGGIIGFALGSLYDNAELAQGQFEKKGKGYRVRYGFDASLLVLMAAVMKADGKVVKSELDYVKKFLVKNYGEDGAKKRLLVLRDIVKKEIDVNSVCFQIRDNLNYSARLQMLHMLFGVAKSDGHIHSSESELIKIISRGLGISPNDFNSISSMFGHDTYGVKSAYKILEINENASDEEVKKAYRRMAMKYHPDKVSSLGEELQETANEKFKRVSKAYDTIKKERGLQ